MNTAQITVGLSNLFHTEGHRIVFWNDPDQEFIDLFPELSMDDIEVIDLQNASLLELKVRLELEDPVGKYLLYSPAPEPAPDKDWLLDIRLYSRSFHADRASILLGELNLSHQSMRTHLAERRKFFASKDRTARLQKLVAKEDREQDIDLKILAVLTRADMASAFDILMQLFGSLCDEEACDLKTVPKAWEEMEKFGLEPFFWDLMAKTFGYAQEQPSLADLLIRLLVTDLAVTLKTGLPDSMSHFLLPEESLRHNATVFAAQWRSNLSHYQQYGRLSRPIANELRIQHQLEAFSAQDLEDVMTFEAVERRIVSALRDQGRQGDMDAPEELKSMLIRRRDGHWATVQLEAYGQGKNVYSAAYDALEAALDILALRTTFDAGFSFPSIDRMYAAYTDELFRFDQLYRLFHEAADRVEQAGWDVLKDLQKTVEACYSGWYMDQIALCWGEFLEGDRGLLQAWSIQDVPQQHYFYPNFVQPILRSNPRSRVFVVISDALRYEVAEELTREINAKSRFKAVLGTQLGVLPSYTALGMAALLPHDQYAYKDQSEQILVDGQPSASLEQRNAILAKHNGIALKMDELMAMSKDQGREAVASSRVVYIYHNQIDATGDSASTEGKTFAAARQAIEELAALIRFLVNGLNGSNIFITADHGFIYQDAPPTPLDKSQMGIKPEGVVTAKKRYILGHDLGASDKAWHGSTKVTARTDDNREFWVPKGANRFHFAGGARFIHGGAMPQEVVVPVIQVKELEGKAAQQEAVTKVGVSLLGSNRKVVNTIQKFEFIQTDKVTDRSLPRTLSISLRDGEELISSEETVTFDSVSESMEERRRSVKLILKKAQYDNKKEYSLVLRDPETKIEYDRIPVTIDLAFINDF